MSNLYQDAILDAKALRASAIANAKAALEEAFEPKIQEMLRAKLSEEEVSEIAEAEELEEVEHGEEDIKEEVAVEESTEINERELDEILAQLEELEQVDEAKQEDLDEAKAEKVEEVKHKELDEAKEEEEEGEEEEAEEGEEEAGEEGEAPEAEEEIVDDETKVIDITLGDLKQVLQSVMGAQADLGIPAEEPTADSDAEAEISLDEILDELENEGAGDMSHITPGSKEGHQEPVYPEMEEGLNENSWTTNARGEQIKPKNPEKPKTRHELDKEFGPVSGPSKTRREGVVNEDAAVYQQLVDFIQSLSGQISPEAAKNLANTAIGFLGAGAGLGALKLVAKNLFKALTSAVSKAKSPFKEGKDHTEELEEAKATIETLRKDLQEVNLLNAKYLYMNKLFKSKSLTESQKVKVINALDRATTVVEVKNTYETLRESFETKKQTIKESIGFASKPAGVAPKANIVEADGFISRWQKLAGIKK